MERAHFVGGGNNQDKPEQYPQAIREMNHMLVGNTMWVAINMKGHKPARRGAE